MDINWKALCFVGALLCAGNAVTMESDPLGSQDRGKQPALSEVSSDIFRIYKIDTYGDINACENKIEIYDEIVGSKRKELVEMPSDADSCVPSELRDSFREDTKNYRFIKRDPMVFISHAYPVYMSPFYSLELSVEEYNILSGSILEYSMQRRGISPDKGKMWDRISNEVEYRILIYSYKDSRMCGFYEYGKKFAKNGTKRLYEENKLYKVLERLTQGEIQQLMKDDCDGVSASDVNIEERILFVDSERTPISSEYFNSTENTLCSLDEEN